MTTGSSLQKEVLFNAFPKQVEFLEACFSGKYKFILYGGAIRGGKSYALLGFFLMCCKMFPGSKYLIVRKDLQRIRDTVLPTFERVKPARYVRQEPSQSNGWEFVGTNGSVIKFYAENIEKDPELKRFRGLEYDSIGFEELDIQEDTFQIGMQRCGTWKMEQRQRERKEGNRTPPSIVVATSNPQQGWVKAKIYDKWKDGTLNPNWLYIRSRVYDNPYIEESWIKDQKDNTSLLIYQQMIDGDWDVNLNEKPFFHDFKDERHTIPGHLTIDPEEVVSISFDFNVDPCTCTIGQKIWGKGCFVIMSMGAFGGTSNLLHKLEWLKESGLIIEVFGDHSGHSRNSASEYTDFDLIEEFFDIRAEPITRKANQRHIFSRSLCNRLFFKNIITISREGCPELLKDIILAKPDKRGGLLKNDQNPNHYTDNFRYLINGWFSSISEVNEFAEYIQAG